MTKADALREHEQIVELQRNAAHSSAYIARAAASRAAASIPASADERLVAASFGLAGEQDRRRTVSPRKVRRQS